MKEQPRFFRVIVDSVVAATGVLMILNETFFAPDPRWLVMAVALIVLGFVPAHNISDILGRK